MLSRKMLENENLAHSSKDECNYSKSGACRPLHMGHELSMAAQTVLICIWLPHSCCLRQLLTGELSEVDGVVA